MNMDEMAELHYAAHDPEFEPEPVPDWAKYREQLEEIMYEVEEARDTLRTLNAEYGVKMSAFMYYIDKALDLIERQMNSL